MKKILACPGMLVVMIGVLITGCVTDVDVEDPHPPVPPQWQLPDPVNTFPKTGIYATEGSAGFRFVWMTPPEEDITGLLLYRSMQRWSDYSEQTSLELEKDSSPPSLEENTVSRDSIYYYYSVAEDYAGNHSDPSDTLRLLLLQPPRLSEFTEPVSQTPTFRWQIDQIGRAHV